MKRTDIMRLPAAERETKLAELQLELMKLRTKQATGATQKDSGRIRAARKGIARLLTSQRSSGGKGKQ
jgi:ribosomal protein L29